LQPYFVDKRYPPFSTFYDTFKIVYSVMFFKIAFPLAIRHLHLPLNFKDILTPDWQTALKQYEPPRLPRPEFFPLTMTLSFGTIDT
jgi:hypothetical protein